ncbi:MAG: hypothetical protein ACYCO3_10095, partial [Mycobacteriales bacterium]
MTRPTPTPRPPHPLIVRFVLHPGATLRHLLHDLAHLALAGLAHLAPPLLLAAAVVLSARALFGRWRTGRARRDVILLELSSPPTVGPEAAAAFWANAHALLAPSWRQALGGGTQLVFTIRCGAGRVRFGLWTPRPLAGHLGRAVVATWPGATVTEATAESWPSAGRLDAACELRLATRQCLPIATDHGLDPLRAVLGAAAELASDETAFIQVVARTASGQLRRRAQRELRHLQGLPAPHPVVRFLGPIVTTVLDLLTPGTRTYSKPGQRPTPLPHPGVRVAREKLTRPCFEAVVQLGVATTADDRALRNRRRGRVKALSAAFGGYAGDNRLTVRRLTRSAFAEHRMSRGDLYSVGEIAALAHLPLDRDIPGVSRAGARVMPAPPELTERGKLLGD